MKYWQGAQFLRSVSECLNHFLFFGTKYLDHVARTWLAHYHAERPHQGCENELLDRPLEAKTSAAPPDDRMLSFRHVRCRKLLGGLLKYYERVAS